MSEELNSFQKPDAYFSEREKKRFVSTPLILALIGLITSAIYGLGGIVAIFSLVLSSKRLKVKKSDSLKWAKTISLITIAISVLYFVAVVSAIVYGNYEIMKLSEETACI